MLCRIHGKSHLPIAIVRIFADFSRIERELASSSLLDCLFDHRRDIRDFEEFVSSVDRWSMLREGASDVRSCFSFIAEPPAAKAEAIAGLMLGLPLAHSLKQFDGQLAKNLRLVQYLIFAEGRYERVTVDFRGRLGTEDGGPRVCRDSSYDRGGVSDRGQMWSGGLEYVSGCIREG
jgi:hypothetical protein